MKWYTVNTQSELNELNQKIDWSDSESIEYYASPQSEGYFPSDVSRSGYTHKNVHVLCRVYGDCPPYLEMVWIHCDYYWSHFIDHPHLNGRVDSLKRIEIHDQEKVIEMRCACLIYRFIDNEIAEENYFRNSICSKCS